MGAIGVPVVTRVAASRTSRATSFDTSRMAVSALCASASADVSVGRGATLVSDSVLSRSFVTYSTTRRRSHFDPRLRE